MPTPLAEQIDEVAREVRQRQRVYPRFVDEGRYKKETAEKKLADLIAAHGTLLFLQKYADPIKALIRTLQQFNPYEGKIIPDNVIEDLLADSRVREVMDVFPGAVITDVRPMQTEFLGLPDIDAEEQAEA